MTDQMIPADLSKDDVAAARDWASHVLKTPKSSTPMEQSAARVLDALLPPPPMPTMASMTEYERETYQWMQCDAGPARRRGVITETDSWAVYVVDKETGEHSNHSPDLVIPRPDLPRLTWPGTETPAPALPEGWRLADHPHHGRVIVNPEPDVEGDMWFIDTSADHGHMEGWCYPGELTYLDGPRPRPRHRHRDGDDADRAVP